MQIELTPAEVKYLILAVSRYRSEEGMDENNLDSTLITKLDEAYQAEDRGEWEKAIPEDLVLFLHNRCVYYRFCRNIAELNPKKLWGQVASAGISGAFVWEDTPEGDRFWRRLDEDYREWKNSR